jgi:hypothetical protein
LKGPEYRGCRSVLAGFLLIGLLGFLTDTVLQQLGILPIPTEHKFETGHALLALSYHLLFAVLGGLITARLAPDHPIAHAITLGILGIVISTLGLIAIIRQDLAPAWYGWALIVFSISSRQESMLARRTAPAQMRA